MDAYRTVDHTPDSAAIRFVGERRVFRNLVIRGTLLELITFGFYRFWLTTDLRRHLWSHTEIDGDALEYTGRGKELLLGFLIATAILAPVFIGYSLLGMAAESYKALASLPLYLFIYLFGQFAVFRARRYRLTRTVWRGVRFWMTGSGWGYAVRALGWMGLTILTLGFAYPFQMAALERYKFSHTHYGDLDGQFVATGGALFRRVWWIWLLGTVPMALLYGGLIFEALVTTGETKFTASGLTTSFPIVVGCAGLIGLPFLHAMRKAEEWRWWISGIRFGQVGVESDLPRTSLIGIYWALIGMCVLMMIGFGIVAFIDSRVFVAGPTHGHPPIGGLIAYGLTYLGLIVAMGVLFRLYTVQAVWAKVAGTCRISNPLAAGNVTAAGEAASAIGEGLADGLDFAGF